MQVIENQYRIVGNQVFNEDGDRTQLCSDIWDKASPKINYYWRDGTFDALEELRTKELYGRNYDTSISRSSRHL